VITETNAWALETCKGLEISSRCGEHSNVIPLKTDFFPAMMMPSPSECMNLKVDASLGEMNVMLEATT
jgi:hypothetical protein